MGNKTSLGGGIAWAGFWVGLFGWLIADTIVSGGAF